MKIISKGGKVKSNLRGEQKTLEHIIQNSSSMFYEHDLDGNFLFFSPQVKDYLGYSPEEIKMKWYELISDHPDNQIAFERTNKAIETGKKQPPYEIELVSKSGRKLWFEISEAPFLENGQVVSIVGSLVDITEKRNAAEKLKLSEEKFSKAFFNNPNVIILSSLEDGKILEINEFGAKSLEFKRDEIIGKTSLDLNIITVENRNRILEELKKKGKYSGLELKVRTKSGKEKVGLFYGQLIKIGNKNYLFQTITDITEIRNAERALKDSEEKFSKAFYLSPDGISISRLSDGKVIDINVGFEKIFGLSRDEVLGKTSKDLKIYQDLADRDHIINAVKHEGSIRNYEVNYVGKDNKKGICEVSSQLIKIGEENYLLTLVRDITERKKAQYDLKVSEEKFSKAFFSNQDGMIVTRAKDGKIIEINDGIEKIFGYSRSEAIGNSTIKLNFWNKLSDRKKVLKLIKTEGRVTNYVAGYNTKSGKKGVVEVSMEPIKIEGEDHLITTVKDITQKLLIDEEIIEYQKNLKSLSTEIILAEERERRRIALNLHDQLGQSLAMTKIKLSEAVKENEFSTFKEKLEAAKKYLDNAISDSRSITYELSPPILYELGFAAAMKWQLDRVSEENKIKVAFEDKSSADISLNDEVKILLFRVALELINNAVKHSMASKLTASMNNDKEYLYLEIEDNGKGFDKDKVIKEAIKNRSFGLFSIRERISYVKGEMTIDSKIGEGTKIKIKIPFQAENDKEIK